MTTRQRLEALEKWAEALCVGREYKSPAPDGDITRVKLTEPKVYLGWFPGRGPRTEDWEEASNEAPGILIAPGTTCGQKVEVRRFDENSRVRRPPELGQTVQISMHKWFYNTQCPGDYLTEKFGWIADEVNKRLDAANVPKVTTVYDLSAVGLPETLAEGIRAELESAGYSAVLTAREVKQELPVTPAEPEGYHSIAGEAVATAAQMIAYIKAKRPGVEQSVIDMIPLYLTEGKAEGIAGDIAFAQSCVETGLFALPQETCAVKLSQNNFAMMGVTSTFAQGESFATPQIGIRAQIQHLKAYANAESLKGVCVDPRFKLVTRGSAPYVEWLGQKENPQGKGWASSAGYGKKILDALAEIRGTQAPAVDKPAEDTLALGNVVTMQGGAPVYGANKEFCSWVYSKNLCVRGIDGDKITVSIYRTGAVTGNVHRKYLTKV